VPYHLQILPEVEQYLARIPDLSADGLRELLADVAEQLTERAEVYQRLYPLAHESHLFEYQSAVVDDGRLFIVRVVVDGSAMPAGVVRLLYADHEVLSPDA
jgi:hypothetical protein